MRNKAQLTLINRSVPPPRSADTTRAALTGPSFGTKMLAVVDNGAWEAHAVGRHAHLDATLRVTRKLGTRTSSLQAAWTGRSGTKSLLRARTTTRRPADLDRNERRFVTAVANVAGGNTRLTLHAPLAYFHWGEIQTYHMSPANPIRLTTAAEVGVLTSNVRIVGDMDASPQHREPANSQFRAANLQRYMQYGCHTIAAGPGARMRVDGLEFMHCGQGGRLARYPLHWHFVGETLGEQYVRRALVHDSFSRTITIHQTHGALVQDCVLFDTYGHSLYFEDGVETDNRVDGNLVVLARRVGASGDSATNALGNHRIVWVSRLQPARARARDSAPVPGRHPFRHLEPRTPGTQSRATLPRVPTLGFG